VGPACQWQCRAAPSPDWLPWAALSGHVRGGLNELPTAPRPPPDSLAHLPRPSRWRPDRHPPPDSRSPAHLAPRAAVPTAPRPDRRGPKPPSPGPSPCHPSTPSCHAAVHAPVSRAMFPQPSLVRRWGTAVRQPCNATAAHCAAVRRALRWLAELGRARCAGRDQAGPRPT
jgi:hypothetical protein